MTDPAMTPGKAEGAMRTIGEVSTELGVKPHILRYWETRFAQLRPLQRAGKRRYYRPEDVVLARRINSLLNQEGYTIKGVQKLLRDNGNQFLVAIGNGDLAAVEVIAQRKQAALEAEEQQSAARPRNDDEMLVGQPKAKPGRRFFGLGKGEDEGSASGEEGRLSRDNRALLQEALFDLLECKRLLD